jgi:hypothetical protein
MGRRKHKHDNGGIVIVRALLRQPDGAYVLTGDLPIALKLAETASRALARGMNEFQAAYAAQWLNKFPAEDAFLQRGIIVNTAGVETYFWDLLIDPWP